MLECGDKTFDEIQQILASTEAKFVSKRLTGMNRDLAIMSSGNRNSAEKKATSKDKCFNCHKIDHFGRDCIAPHTQSFKKKFDEVQRQQKRN